MATLDYSLTMEAIDSELEQEVQDAENKEQEGADLLAAEPDAGAEDEVAAIEGNEESSEEDSKEATQEVVIPNLQESEFQTASEEIQKAQEEAIETAEQAEKDTKKIQLSMESLAAQIRTRNINPQSINRIRQELVLIRQNYGQRSPQAGLRLEALKSHEEAGELTLEGLANTLKAIWNGLIAFAKKVIAAIKEYVRKLFDRHIYEANMTRSLVKAIEANRKELSSDYLRYENLDEYVSAPLVVANLLVEGKQPPKYETAFDDITDLSVLRDKTLEYFTTKGTNAAHSLGFEELTRQIVHKSLTGVELEPSEKYKDFLVYLKAHWKFADMPQAGTIAQDSMWTLFSAPLLGEKRVVMKVHGRAVLNPIESIEFLKEIKVGTIDNVDQMGAAYSAPQYLRFLDPKQIEAGSKRVLFMADKLINDRSGSKALENLEKLLTNMSREFSTESDKIVLQHPDRAALVNSVVLMLQNCTNFISGCTTVFPEVAIGAHYAWNGYLRAILAKERGIAAREKALENQ